MQDRLVELISQLTNDEVTADLLRMNDLLNNLFLRYAVIFHWHLLGKGNGLNLSLPAFLNAKKMQIFEKKTYL